jgi:hypothetical protein
MRIFARRLSAPLLAHDSESQTAVGQQLMHSFDKAEARLQVGHGIAGGIQAGLTPTQRAKLASFDGVQRMDGHGAPAEISSAPAALLSTGSAKARELSADLNRLLSAEQGLATRVTATQSHASEWRHVPAHPARSRTCFRAPHWPISPPAALTRTLTTQDLKALGQYARTPAWKTGVNLQRQGRNVSLMANYRF